MFLHIGGNISIPTREIIGIFSYSSHENKITGEFLKTFEEKGYTLSVDNENQRKSFIVTDKEIYYSPIAANTLKKRANLAFNSSQFKKLEL